MKTKLFVFDTNILIGSFITNSKATIAFEKAKDNGKLLVSDDTFNEFCDVFIRKKFDKYLSLETRLDILNGFQKVAIFSKVSVTITDCRDSNDNKFLELAISQSGIESFNAKCRKK
ncbi:MAG: putative toxin-antitoxin system toxin component, PIN family [Ginsengibacter sp.]